MKKFFRHPINASLSPNTEIEDVLLAVSVLSRPWMWRQGRSLDHIRDWFKRVYDVSGVQVFNSGRSAFLALLKTYGVGDGDEVVIQAFTCVAVPNSIIWAGATPVYCDIDKTYNLDINDLKQKITPQTKAIVIQHTFGIPAAVEKIIALAKKHKIIVIEDCAHALGAKHDGKLLGTFGHAAFFSFGRDKVVSSVFGGAAIINKASSVKLHASSRTLNARMITNRLRQYHGMLPQPSYVWILQQLLHPIAFSVILPTYNISLGKVMLVVLQALRLVSKPVYAEECKTKQPNVFPRTYPNALARLLEKQLTKIDRFNENRQETARLYQRELKDANISLSPRVGGAIYLRYPIEVEGSTTIRQRAKKNGILLGNWYHNVVDPGTVDLHSAGYTPRSCPQAEKKAKYVLNLPTRVSSRQAHVVISLLRECG